MTKNTPYADWYAKIGRSRPLLDSVDLHALAWHEAKFSHDVSFEQARGQIGKGGDN